MSQLTQIQLQKLIHNALRAYNTLIGTSENFLSMLLLVKKELATSTARSPTAKRLAANKVINDALDMLRVQDPDGAKILRLRFIEEEIAARVKLIMDLSEDQVKRRQRDAIQNLTQIVWEREMAQRQHQIDLLDSQLPPANYSDLFGINDQLGTLLQSLTDENGRFLLALVGIGGIGKTALADCVTRAAIQFLSFDKVVWLRVESAEGKTAVSIWQYVFKQLIAKLCAGYADASLLEQQTQLKKALKEIPTLIVIDNLESSEVVQQLAEHAPAYANPSKFLFTSRVQFPVTAPIFTVTLNEISSDATFQLLRNLAQEKGLTDLVQASDETLLPIYRVTGGNPLAIKIVTGLALNMPLANILADFEHVHTDEVDGMYKHIYWQAWHSLSEAAQILLEMMPLASDRGLSSEQIRAATGLNESQIWPSINRLVNHSLLEVRGSLIERRYGIHQLTDSFLKTEIIQLPTQPQQYHDNT